jgi:hypothetical protein
MENKKKVIAKSLRNALKKKNKVEGGGALSLGMKREQESIEIKA